MGDRPAPAAETAVGVHGLRPFVQITPLDLILFGVLALRFQNEHVAVDEADQQDVTAAKDTPKEDEFFDVASKPRLVPVPSPLRRNPPPHRPRIRL